MNIQQFLQEQHVPFDTIDHPRTTSAQRMAGTLHVPGDMVAKTVVLKADAQMIVAILPATRDIDLSLAMQALGAHSLAFAFEEELAEIFPDCDTGVVPPFGSQYGLRTLVDISLTEDEYIVFEGMHHDEAITMRYRDYEKVENPEVGSFSRHL